MGHRGAVNGTAESRPKAPAGGDFLGQFLGPHIAAGEGQMAVGDVKALHHAIAVKPVVVAGAAESVQGRAVTIKRPGEESRPPLWQRQGEGTVPGERRAVIAGQPGLAGPGLLKRSLPGVVPRAGLGGANRRHAAKGDRPAGGQRQKTPASHFRAGHGHSTNSMVSRRAVSPS